jgi:SNF2 family DNA or RNA helicase
VDAVVQLSNAICIEESSIVIFSHYVKVAKEIQERLAEMDWTVELLTGETPPTKRQAMVDRFQSGLSPVFVCTYGAGSVGLTLTGELPRRSHRCHRSRTLNPLAHRSFAAACTTVLVDRPWTPGDVAQAEDRVRRIGQTRPVRSIWIKAFPIDEQMDKLIDAKQENSNTAVDGKGGDSHNKSAPTVKIAELVRLVLRK